MQMEHLGWPAEMGAAASCADGTFGLAGRNGGGGQLRRWDIGAGGQKWRRRPAAPMGYWGWSGEGARVGNWGSGLRAFSAEGGEGGCGFAKGAARKTGPQNPRKRRLRRAWIVLNRRTVLELP